MTNIVEENWKEFLLLAENPDEDAFTEDQIESMRLIYLGGAKMMFREVAKCVKLDDHARFEKIEGELEEFYKA